MSFGLNSLKGVILYYIGNYVGDTYRAIKRDTRG